MDIPSPLSLCSDSNRITECESKVPRKEPHDWFHIEKRLDSGASGVVYAAITKTGKRIILKVFEGEIESIDHEICYQHMASLNGVAPPILDYWWCGNKDKSAAIVMDYAGTMSLGDYFNTLADVEIDDIESLKYALQAYRAMISLHYKTLVLNYESKIFQLDMHLNNIFVTTDDDNYITDLKIIDYGKSVTWNDMMENYYPDICQGNDVSKKFNAIVNMNKALFVDLMMPTEFIVDRYVKHVNYDYNPVFQWLNLDYIQPLQQKLYLSRAGFWKQGTAEGDSELLREENILQDLPDRLENTFDFINDDEAFDLAVYATTLPSLVEENEPSS